MGLSRPVMGLLYLYLLKTTYHDCTSLSDGKHSCEVYLFGIFQIPDAQGPDEAMKYLSLSNRRCELLDRTGVEGYLTPKLLCPARTAQGLRGYDMIYDMI
jgi:hypothetical protein